MLNGLESKEARVFNSCVLACMALVSQNSFTHSDFKLRYACISNSGYAAPKKN